MRFSQPMNRNISKGIRGMKMSEGNNVRDKKTRELASNEMLLCQ
jgi:hypothetical protein